MFEITALICIAAALALLVALSVIDLRHWILPDELNFALGVTGLAFHYLTQNRFADYADLAMGAAVGAGMLYVIRFFSNRHYGRDTLGLGDVKLMGAAGLWLGLDGVLGAVTIGAFAGILHGIGHALWLTLRHKQPFRVAQLQIPAGPGFCIGIALSGWWLAGGFIIGEIHALFA